MNINVRLRQSPCNGTAFHSLSGKRDAEVMHFLFTVLAAKSTDYSISLRARRSGERLALMYRLYVTSSTTNSNAYSASIYFYEIF